MQNSKSQTDYLSYVADGVYQAKILFVGAYFIDTPQTGADSWVLIDTGLLMTCKFSNRL